MLREAAVCLRKTNVYHVVWRALSKNGYDQENEPTIFLPSGVHH